MARIDARYPDRVRRFKVVDPSLPATDPYEGVVGISQWRIFPRDRSPEELAAEKKWTQADEAKYGQPEGLNVEMVEAFGAKHGALKDKYLGGRAHVYLHVLMTRPGFQRKGVGTLALQWGVDQADALGLPAYIESSEQGAGLYKKFGFKEIDVSPFDGRDWGHHNQMKHIIMWRDPKKGGSD
jgi:GNAT superfamily N-acetyltransferase